MMINQANDNERIRLLDYCRGLAIVAVVFCHSIGETIHIPISSSLSSIAGLVLHQLCMSAIPMFFFVTGYFSSDGVRKGIGRWLGKAVTKIYIPYLIWAIMFFALIGSAGARDIRGIALKVALFANVFYYLSVHMSFIVSALLLRYIRDSFLYRMLLASVILSIGFSLFDTGLFYLDVGWHRYYVDYFSLRNPLYWGCYFVGGYVIRRKQMLDRMVQFVSDRLAFLTVIALFIGIIAGLEWFVLKDIMKIRYLDTAFALRLDTQLYFSISIGVVLGMMKKLEESRLTRTKYALAYLGRHSLQIYLAHPVIVFWMGPWFAKHFSENVTKSVIFVLGVWIPIAAMLITRRFSLRLSKVVWGS